jgi:hypothetical protein
MSRSAAHTPPSCPRLVAAAAVLLAFARGQAAPETATTPRMTVISNKDVSGTVYKKLALPSRQYCWDTCLREDRCSGARWGVIAGETAGLCLLMTGPLSLKEPAEPKTADGKPIHVTGARKD